MGNTFTLKPNDADDTFAIFMPHKREDRAARIKLARADGSKRSMDIIEEIGRHWIDLRAAYAQTINKSQGSTYDQVFIDLDDVSKCRNPNQLARMLYVAVSRARTRVYFTGDFK
jgi:ATP-dependent exoDNAse (exonuclease V) alpha subunit